MKQFTKDDLRTGDLVVTRCKGNFIVMLNVGSNSKNTLIGKDGNWCDLNDFLNDLKWIENRLDIMKVYRSEHQFKLLDLERDEYELIYDREAIENKTEKMNSENVVLCIDGEKINATNLEMTIKGFGEKQQEWTIKIKTK